MRAHSRKFPIRAQDTAAHLASRYLPEKLGRGTINNRLVLVERGLWTRARHMLLKDRAALFSKGTQWE